MTDRPDHLSPAARPAASTARRVVNGFTLIELLVVMGIMVLLIALALPAFNFLTGSRSTEAATNQVAAVLSIARAEAVGVQETRGVVVFHDADLDRDVAGLIELRYGPFSDWVAGSKAAPQEHVYGDYVTYNSKNYVCTQPYVDSGGTIKPGALGGSDFWAELSSCNPKFGTGTGADQSPIIEFRTNTDFLTLPKGISLRGVMNPYGVSDAIGTGVTYYRYSTPAVVLFDANGQVKSLNNYRILREGLLGTRARLGDGATAVSPPYAEKLEVTGTGSVNPFRADTAIGLVAFGTDEFKNATTNFNAGQVQDWLDQNGSPLLVNRFNGTLVKGE